MYLCFLNSFGVTQSAHWKGHVLNVVPCQIAYKYICIKICYKFDKLAFEGNKSKEVRGPVLTWKRSSTANSGTKVAVLLGMNRCCNFPLHSALHCLSSIWTDLKRSEKIPGVPSWRWGEWFWLTGPYELHRNSPQGLNISSIRVFDQITDPENPITLRPPPPLCRVKILNCIY